MPVPSSLHKAMREGMFRIISGKFGQAVQEMLHGSRILCIQQLRGPILQKGKVHGMSRHMTYRR